MAVERIIAMIRNNDLDLQPDFQRGEVWSEAKKNRLIDTILRSWHVPPIHIVWRPGSNKHEVLDGQQRLAAIRDFVDLKIRVDGNIEPFDSAIKEADDETYETLPPRLRERFDQFTIEVLTLVDFSPSEPGELFFRLNQTTSLTGAEQRNAFFGPVRDQIREICESFKDYGLNSNSLGFSNSRMAYDDIIAKLCVSLEEGSLRNVISATLITQRYRQTKPFSDLITNRVQHAVECLAGSIDVGEKANRFNKATLFTWFCFLVRLVAKAKTPDRSMLNRFLRGFLFACKQIGEEVELSQVPAGPPTYADCPGDLYVDIQKYPEMLLHIYNRRASQRVSEMQSVLLRDATLVYCFVAFMKGDIWIIENAPEMSHLFGAWYNVLIANPSFMANPLYKQLFKEKEMERVSVDETFGQSRGDEESLDIQVWQLESSLLEQLDTIKWGTFP